MDHHPQAYYYIPLFKPGATVQWRAQHETVSHVLVRRNVLMVYLVGHEAPVYPEALQLALTAFHRRRVPDRL